MPDRDADEILAVLHEYVEAMQADADVRDAVRERLLTDDYFYMGVDGLPISKVGVMARQRRNGLKLDSLTMADVVLHRYGDAAILTMRAENEGVDKGQRFAGSSGLTIVMVNQDGAWRIAGDTMGRAIAD